MRPAGHLPKIGSRRLFELCVLFQLRFRRSNSTVLEEDWTHTHDATSR